jgi:hypothetical protein
MPKNQLVMLQELTSELSEQILGFFTRKNFEEGQKALHKHCDQMLKQIPEMLELLKEYPMYGALAFVGQFEFSDCPEVKELTLSNADSPEVLEEIRAKNAIQISQDAYPQWECVFNHNKVIAHTILCLCYFATTQPKLRKAIQR